ncbi:MAG: Phosphoribosylglycinamide synthetase, partial [Leptospirillum sp. Group IV 'UBA BS']
KNTGRSPPLPGWGLSWPQPAYPDKPTTGDPIEGLLPAGTEFPDGALYFAGVERKNGVLCSSGGRVLTAVGRGETLARAREAAYRIMGTIRLKGGQVRPDIALRETAGDGDQKSGGGG